MRNADSRRALPPLTLGFLQRLFVAVVLIPALTLVAADLPPPEKDPNQPYAFCEANLDRPLRYFPADRAFVITNGTEYFNRPLYAANEAFRIDGGDRPEFSFYLPGQAGNLRFGLRSATEMVWLDQRSQVVARYRPGGLSYEISNGSKNFDTIRLDVLPLKNGRGLIGRVELRQPSLNPIDLFLAFGGVDGLRGRRNGDIGCERVPVSEFFQFQPEQCRGNQIVTTGSVFIVQGKNATMAGLMAPAFCAVAEGKDWNDFPALSRPRDAAAPPLPTETPIALMRTPLTPGQPIYFVIAPVSSNATFADVGREFGVEKLPALFAATETARAAIADRVVVSTPDPFVDAAAAALNVAADAVWDAKQTSFMHGAVAWRIRLLGWRGMYSGDALGWHERTRQHLTGFAAEQNVRPIPERIPPADEDTNLARSRAAIHSNGNLSQNHYDMNLVAIDAFFRHLLWTGDRAFAQEFWPTLERHLAWERRLFRRGFGPDQLPLYEGYAAIWASDDLMYNGGGAAHASAYNFYHNQMAARVARWLGKDPTPYQTEADLIARAMRRELWLPQQGWFAEYKDYLGHQLVHPSAALWTYYHTLDSELPTPAEAAQMAHGLDSQFPAIPLRGPNVPPGNFTLPTSTWMPYSWSINNVVMAEVMHTALAYWQANRLDGAFPLFKGAVLDSMFLGLCPGNVGMCTYFDAHRRESQRDFADGAGATSRALIEGLFGVKPDAIAGELTLRPGFPAAWDHASLHHPDLDFAYRRADVHEFITVTQRFAQPLALRLLLPRYANELVSVTVNGLPAKTARANSPGTPRLEIGGPAASHHEIIVTWRDKIIPPPSQPRPDPRPTELAAATAGYDWNTPSRAQAKWETIDLTTHFNDRVSQIFSNDYRAPRSPFASLATPKQGIGSWCHPADFFVVNDAGLRAVARTNNGKLILPNGLPFATPAALNTPNILFTSQWTNYPATATVPLHGPARHLFLLMAGSTSSMQSRFDNGEIIVTYTDGTTNRLALHNPTNWWPIEEDYFIDDYAFRRPDPLPPRVDLQTGRIRLLDLATFKGRGRTVPGGAATVLEMPLDPAKDLRSLTLHTLANEVVIGLMSITLQRP